MRELSIKDKKSLQWIQRESINSNVVYYIHKKSFSKEIISYRTVKKNIIDFIIGVNGIQKWPTNWLELEDVHQSGHNLLQIIIKKIRRNWYKLREGKKEIY